MDNISKKMVILSLNCIQNDFQERLKSRKNSFVKQIWFEVEFFQNMTTKLQNLETNEEFIKLFKSIG